MAKQILGPVSRSWTTRRDVRRRRIELVKPWMTNPVEVTAEVGLSRNDSGGFVLSAALAVTVTGVAQKKAEDLVESAHKICPYSNAIRGNVEVGITVSAR
jgi:lipoyl-dependent peroxiredoxin